MKCPYMKTVIDYTHTSTVYNSDGLVKEVISQNIYIDNMRVCIKAIQTSLAANQMLL